MNNCVDNYRHLDRTTIIVELMRFQSTHFSTSIFPLDVRIFSKHVNRAHKNEHIVICTSILRTTS